MDDLLEQERQARLEKNDKRMEEIMNAIIQQCTNDTDLITHLKILSKRKGQLKEPLKKILTDVFNKRKSVLTKENTNDFISFSNRFLTEIVEGKFYLEDERIIVTETLKVIYEERGDNKEALLVVFAVPVETFDIDEKIKINYQLEILRLCIKNCDWNKSEIISKRIRKKYFAETGDTISEIKFYLSVVGAALGQYKFNEACEGLKRLYQIDTEEPGKRIALCSFFNVLSTSSSSEKDLLFCLNCKDNSDEVRKILRLFLSKEIIPRNIAEKISNYDFILKHFIANFYSAIDFHNLYVVSLFFSRIKLCDLSGILQLGEDECVSLICEIVNVDIVKAHVDQDSRIITFTRNQVGEVEEQINNVMLKISRVNAMIVKENMDKAER